MPRSKDVQKAHENVKVYSRTKNATNLVLGKFLHEMKEDKKYQEVSGEDTTFATYLADPEVGMSLSSADRYISIYRKFILELGMKFEELVGLDTYLLHAIAPVVTAKNKDEWLDKVKSLSRADLIRELKYPDIDVMKCKHEWKPVKERCDKCGEVQNIRKR